MQPEWVSRYVGLPFRFGGRGDAVDCLGLVVRVYREQLGLEVPDPMAEARTVPDRVAAFTQLLASGVWVPVESPAICDVVQLAIAGLPLHCGIIVDEGRMLHAREGAFTCVEDFRRPQWAPRVRGFFRHRERLP